MENKEITMFDILIETHIGLERQGFGSPEMTLKALSFIPAFDGGTKVADLACGTGGQTITLAQNIAGNIVGVDQIPSFIDILGDKAKKLNMGDRVSGIVGDITNLPFGKEEFDLIWSEGVIDSIGFEKGLTYWNGFLKKGGYVAVTCPSWLTVEHSTEVQKFWTDAGSGLDTIGDNIDAMQKSGYSFVAAFTLPEECWTDNYFIPRGVAEKTFMERHPGNKTVEEYMESSKREVELYSKYKQHYGYVFILVKRYNPNSISIC
jgi:SAM-dependent methyltransferase